ncbi:HAMP domain-containing sensor histidine kinase [Catenuloplanes indicus JCM 9534]|uniref:histidine kinase n=1 Tax=Catenuloplanes indicus TaxID=137267 RepID=A0AAE3VX07_9ACTN|nr:signal transduction histidine kinase [Catenuloplanes indicus]
MITAFTTGAVLLSAAVALISYQLIRDSLLTERERTAVRAAYFDATVVRAEVVSGRGDILEVLRLLDTGGNRRAIVRIDGDWHARSADGGITDAVPAALVAQVEGGRAGMQRVHTGGRPAVVIGIPLSSSAGFYELDSLDELDATLRILALILTTVAVLTGAAGALLGWYSTRYLLRPLHTVAGAAKDIAAGHLDARLDEAADPDLTALTSSFNDMVDKLSARMARDRRFAADVSHELRSPLQTLAATASVLRRGRDRLDDRMAMAVDLMTGEVDRFQALVNDLLELSRDDRPADRTTVDIAELAAEACRLCAVPESIVTVTGDGSWHVDRRRVLQIMTNLLHNAVRYGGGPTALLLQHVDGRYEIVVDDEGPGVRPAEREVIFDRFVRGRPAHARGSTDGTGLGLALVAQHAAAHTGTATVEDCPDGGARFRVRLPEAQA